MACSGRVAMRMIPVSCFSTVAFGMIRPEDRPPPSLPCRTRLRSMS